MSLGLYLHIPYCFSKCRYCDFYSHPGERGVPDAYVDALLRELLGEGDYWVRPPYGLLSEEACAAAATPIINWSVDTEDWKSKDAEKILDIIYRETGDGDIILLHDRYLNSVEAALRAVDHLQQQGYRFVTVAELLAWKGVEPTAGEVYRCAK